MTMTRMRIQQSLPTERAAEIVKEKLEEFGIKEQCHLVAIVTDGARVMVKMGNSFEAFQLL